MRRRGLTLDFWTVNMTRCGFFFITISFQSHRLCPHLLTYTACMPPKCAVKYRLPMTIIHQDDHYWEALFILIINDKTILDFLISLNKKIIVYEITTELVYFQSPLTFRRRMFNRISVNRATLRQSISLVNGNQYSYIPVEYPVCITHWDKQNFF